MAISKAKDPSVMMFPSDFLLLLALLREVVDRAHGGHGGLHGGGGGDDGRTSAAAQGARNSNFVQKLKIRLFGHILSMKPMKKTLFYMKKYTFYCLSLIFSNSFDFLGTFLGFGPLCAALFLDLARELCNFLTPLWRAAPS